MSAVTTLSRTDPTVDPGGQAAITITIRNTGAIVDRFDVDVVGPAAGWVRVDPPSLSLFPGVEGSATITFAPPRASTPRAGLHPFGIRVRPAAEPAGSSVEEGKISVTPFTAVAADVVPQTSRGSRVGRHQVVVANRGNAPSDVVVNAIDPDRRLKLDVQPPRAVVAPDDRIEFGVRVQVDDPFPFGAARQRAFQVSVEPGRQEPILLRPTLNQLPMLPGWIPPVAAAVAIVAVLGIGSFLAKAGPVCAGGHAQPEPRGRGFQRAIGGRLGRAEPGALGSAERGAAIGRRRRRPPRRRRPSSPVTSRLTVTGDDVELGGGLSVLCASTDKACRRSAKEVVLAMVNELQNPYTGQGIVEHPVAVGAQHAAAGDVGRPRLQLGAGGRRREGHDAIGRGRPGPAARHAAHGRLCGRHDARRHPPSLRHRRRPREAAVRQPLPAPAGDVDRAGDAAARWRHHGSDLRACRSGTSHGSSASR